MAQYFGQSRTNYFLVKDEDAFKAEMEKYNVTVITSKIDDQTAYGIMDADDDGGGLAWSQYNDDTEDYDDIPWEHVIGQHLQDGQVAILVETGAEKYRYLSGWAVAFNNKGEFRRIDISDIFELAKELGTSVTPAEY